MCHSMVGGTTFGEAEKVYVLTLISGHYHTGTQELKCPDLMKVLA